MENQKQVFKSRVSVSLIVLLLAVYIPCIWLIFKYMILAISYIAGGALFLIFFFVVLVLFSITGFRYIILENRLYLKVWIVHIGSASIADIISVERTSDPTSSPAASLKRLRIRFKSGTRYSNWLTWQTAPDWLLSPVREQEFVEELRTINPDIFVNIS
ncbi:MAG: PH domain-containing protein [Bacteroidales bacterium]|nr:PH domain-containing protein [Bacteroidales bacterium]